SRFHGGCRHSAGRLGESYGCGSISVRMRGARAARNRGPAGVIPVLRFAPFRLDAANERLWRGPEPVALRPKSFALLRYLAERPGRLVRKHELLEAIWPDTFVTDVVLKVCMNELRRALDDDPKAPRFIETVHRRGYRFVAAVDSALDAGDRAPGADTATSAPARIVVGREREIAALTAAFREVLAGRRQTIFVAGEAGIGKTTLVDAFLDRARALAGDAGLWSGRGRSHPSGPTRSASRPATAAGRSPTRHARRRRSACWASWPRCWRRCRSSGPSPS